MKLKLETLIAGLAFLVAATSLYYTIKQHQAARQHDRLSVVPYLTFRWIVDHENYSYTLAVRNTGLGPARVTGFQLQLNGKPVVNDNRGGWEHVFKELDLLERLTSRDIDVPAVGDGIAPGDSRSLFAFSLLADSIKSKFIALPAESPQEPPVSESEKRKRAAEYVETLFQGILDKLTSVELQIEYESFYGEQQPPTIFRFPNAAKTRGD